MPETIGSCGIRRPSRRTGALLTVDLIIGQKDLNGGSANEGQTAPSAKSIALASGGAIFRSGIAFDAQGNLWLSDAGNNRVLRFPANALGSRATNEPAADLVLGQPDFVSNQIPRSASQSQCGSATITSQRCGMNFLIQPSGLAFDPKGRLFVADNANRVVVYAPPFSLGQPISRIMGVVLPTAQQPVPPVVSESTLGAIISGGVIPPVRRVSSSATILTSSTRGTRGSSDTILSTHGRRRPLPFRRRPRW